MTSLSVAIVTKNRPDSLARCLKKIESQSRIPIKIIENLPVPVARNKAIEWCQTSHLCFIDDDCVVSSNYISTALKAIKKNAHAAFIVGKSQLGNPKSLTAQAQYIHQSYWFHQKRVGSQATAWNLDTKNCILNLTIIKPLGLTFDKKIAINGYDSSDTDFGFELAKHHLTGIYEPKLIVDHSEAVGIKNMLRKASLRGKLAFLLYHKWNLKNELVDLGNQDVFYRIKQLRRLPEEYHQYQASLPVFMLIKLYQEAYFQGFLKSLRSNNASA